MLLAVSISSLVMDAVGKFVEHLRNASFVLSKLPSSTHNSIYAREVWSSMNRFWCFRELFFALCPIQVHAWLLRKCGWGEISEEWPHVIQTSDKDGASPDPRKVEAIKAAEPPRNAKELNSFLCEKKCSANRPSEGSTHSQSLYLEERTSRSVREFEGRP